MDPFYILTTYIPWTIVLVLSIAEMTKRKRFVKAIAWMQGLVVASLVIEIIRSSIDEHSVFAIPGVCFVLFIIALSCTVKATKLRALATSPRRLNNNNNNSRVVVTTLAENKVSLPLTSVATSNAAAPAQFGSAGLSYHAQSPPAYNDAAAAAAPASSAPPFGAASVNNFCTKCGSPRGAADNLFCGKCGAKI